MLALNGTNHGQIPGGWFLEPELAGGGAVMDHTVHLADLLRWMLDVEVKSVYAEVDSFFGAGGADDAAILTLELEGGSFADGAFATIDPSWSRGDGYPTWGDVTLRISGTSGVLDVDPFAQPLRTFDHETGAPSWSYMGEDMNALMLAGFPARRGRRRTIGRERARWPADARGRPGRLPLRRRPRTKEGGADALTPRSSRYQAKPCGHGTRILSLPW